MTLEQRRTRPRSHKPVHYPESDGKPMGETDLHRDEMYRLIYTLQDAYAARPDVYVSGNLILYYVEGNPRASVSPDVFVVFGIAKHRRDLYKLWEEGAGPAIVIEVTSRSTRREDLGKKRALYARLGVREYYLYDPRFLGLEYLNPSLQGLRLVEGEYQPMAADAVDALISDALGMRLRLVDGRLRLFTHEDTPLLSPAERAVEEAERADAESQRADAERQRADAEGQRADTESQRADDERIRAEGERGRAEAEREKADAERVRAETAERRLAELEALLRERGS